MDLKQLETSESKKLLKIHSLQDFLRLPNLQRALIYKDCISARQKPHKFLAWFQDKSDCCFETFEWIDNIKPLDNWNDDDILRIENVQFRCHKVETSMNIWEITREDWTIA